MLSVFENKNIVNLVMILNISLFLVGCTPSTSSITSSSNNMATSSSSSYSSSSSSLSSSSSSSSDCKVEASESSSGKIDMIASNVARLNKEHTYIHGSDGYYSLVDEGIIVNPVKAQLSGTCWVTAGANALETSYMIDTGKNIVIEPLDILYDVLGADKSEGYFVHEHTDELNIGGNTMEIAETLSNCFGDYILTDATDYIGCDLDTIKNGIRQNGALVVGLNDSRYGRFDGYKTLIAYEWDDLDHGVSLCGWDDNFPKEYFPLEASSNGAWLAQNTRGPYWGTDGYFWISYDTYFEEIMNLKLSDEYNGVLSYDGGNQDYISTGSPVTVANIFHLTDGIKAIGTYNSTPSQKITIEIYDSGFANILYTQEAILDLKGYHTIPLEGQISETDVAVAITFDQSAPVEGASQEYHGVDYTVSIDPGKSYIKLGNEWLDLSLDSTINALNIDYTPNNACIKVLY